ncbi:hypothetical protein T439DRAFT_325702 [Meredithblackwellia eburnea MCA 4105]
MTSDEALSTLRSMFPSDEETTLLRFLDASRGDLQRATNALLSREGRETKRRKTESGIKGWLSTGSNNRQNSSKPTTNWFKEGSFAVASSSAKQQAAAPTKSANAFTTLLSSSSTLSPSKTKPETSTIASKAAKLPPLLLSTPSQVSQATNGLLTLIPDVLPKELATTLFLSLLEESKGGKGAGGEKGRAWQKNTWYMFDRQVSSPHTSAFYVEQKEEGEEEDVNVEDKTTKKERTGSEVKRNYDQEAYDEAAKSWYNGQPRSTRPFNSNMDSAREVVGPLVRQVLGGRKRHKLEFDGPWLPNVAAANCYEGAKEGVGYHSDVLTHLGPMPTIASLSLGVTRVFRLRPFMPGDDEKEVVEERRTLDVRLPHGSLLIMHAGCQEKFKHSIPIVSTMDVFRVPKSLQTEELLRRFGEKVASEGFRARINLTFRHYRPDFSPIPVPSSNYLGTPKCRCGIPCLLRPDGRGRVKARLARESGGKLTKMESRENVGENGENEFFYFWTCTASMQTPGGGCGFFEILDMEKEGRGPWWKGGKNGSG